MKKKRELGMQQLGQKRHARQAGQSPCGKDQANLRCNTRACRVKLALVMQRDTLSRARPVGG